MKLDQQDRLRRNPTPAEVALRDLLDLNPETKGRYRFQDILYGYIPDFLCRKAKLIIEADGWHHTTTLGKLADQRRTNAFKRRGFQVLRFSNTDIFKQPEVVLDRIRLVQRARLDN